MLHSCQEEKPKLPTFDINKQLISFKLLALSFPNCHLSLLERGGIAIF